MPRHADQTELSKNIGREIRRAQEIGWITDAGVTAANTVDGLKTAVSTAAAADTTHGETAPIANSVLRSIDQGREIGDFSDAAILNLTTVDALVALTALGADKHRGSGFMPN